MAEFSQAVSMASSPEGGHVQVLFKGFPCIFSFNLHTYPRRKGDLSGSGHFASE